MPPEYGFIALMPQWDFLQFLAEKGRKYPPLKISMGARKLAKGRSKSVRRSAWARTDAAPPCASSLASSVKIWARRSTCFGFRVKYEREKELEAPLLFRLATHSSSLRRLLGRIVGLGVRPEHVLHREEAAQ